MATVTLESPKNHSPVCPLICPLRPSPLVTIKRRQIADKSENPSHTSVPA